MSDIGFVYEWTNIINGKKYIGSHKGINFDDGYIGGGIAFNNAVKKYGIVNFEREILYIGENFRMMEESYLNSVDAANNTIYYNLKNEALGGAFFR